MRITKEEKQAIAKLKQIVAGNPTCFNTDISEIEAVVEFFETCLRTQTGMSFVGLVNVAVKANLDATQ